MEMLALKTHPISNVYPKIIVNGRQFANIFTISGSLRRKCLPYKIGLNTNQLLDRGTRKCLVSIRAVSSGVQKIDVPSSFEDFTVTISGPDLDNNLKILAEVSGMKTQEIFDVVFSKMVADAQPIPGFRRVKGGKTPNIPKDILLEILGPSKVHQEVIKKIISSTIAEYISKEGLTVGKDLQVEQSFEDLEAGFEPGETFRFDAIVQCVESR